MRIDFVRHGETDWNRIRRVQGRGPVPLNAHGERQADRLGDRYRGEKIDALYASGLVRAMQTARRISEATDKEVTVDERLAEIDHGEVEGLMLPELTAQFPEILRLWSTSPDLVVYPGGEAMIEVQKRMIAALEGFRARHRGEWIVVVSHQFALSTLFAAILEAPLRRMRTFRLAAGSVTRFEWSDLGPQLVGYNMIEHLAGLDLRAV
ncbi:MAG: histidine phosphatase family protein [Deltaproteobacteria bacterium]|nr:histidine phosphatase family protein [Deltaproteobacteria bacterium]